MLCLTLCLLGGKKGQEAGEPESDIAGQIRGDEPGPRLSQEASRRLEPGLMWSIAR